jgi:hypothetical protein
MISSVSGIHLPRILPRRIILLVCDPFPSYQRTDDSERLGPIEGNTVIYSAQIPAGERVRITVRDNANRSFDGSAFTDLILIG